MYNKEDLVATMLFMSLVEQKEMNIGSVCPLFTSTVASLHLIPWRKKTSGNRLKLRTIPYPVGARSSHSHPVDPSDLNFPDSP